SQTGGTYTVRATARDAAGNTFAGTPVSFTLLGSIFPTNLGTAASGSQSNQTVSSLTSSATVAAGNTIFVTVAMDGPTSTSPTLSPTVTVRDNATGGINTYTKDADVW